MTAIQAPAGAELTAEVIAARSGSNFLTGFACLDAERRAGMTAIYAFCRVVDDAVDDAPDAATARAHVAFWTAELDAVAAGRPGTPIGGALRRALQRFGGDTEALRELLAGVAMDIEPQGSADEDELRLYCHRVASAVGLACLPVLGATSAGARTFAIAIGQALQSTNILRDLRPDADGGRIYVPRTWLAACGVEPAWLRGDADPAVYAPGGPLAKLCERLAARAREHFVAARTALRCLPRRERRALVAARIMGAIYGELLTRLERRGGDVRGERVRVPKLQKLWLVLLVLVGARA